MYNYKSTIIQTPDSQIKLSIQTVKLCCIAHRVTITSQFFLHNRFDRKVKQMGLGYTKINTTKRQFKCDQDFKSKIYSAFTIQQSSMLTM